MPPKEAILIHLREAVGADCLNRVPVYPQWGVNVDDPWYPEDRQGPFGRATLGKGEHILLFGHDLAMRKAYSSKENKWVLVPCNYLKFLRLANRQYVWISTHSILKISMFEKARRSILKYCQKNKLSVEPVNGVDPV